MTCEDCKWFYKTNETRGHMEEMRIVNRCGAIPQRPLQRENYPACSIFESGIVEFQAKDNSEVNP